jgi:hypothetical protein
VDCWFPWRLSHRRARWGSWTACLLHESASDLVAVLGVGDREHWIRAIAVYGLRRVEPAGHVSPGLGTSSRNLLPISCAANGMTSMTADPIRDAARGAVPARPRARRPRPGARTGAAGAPWGRIRAPSATVPRGPPNEPRLASRARLSRVCRPCRDRRLNTWLAGARTRNQGIAQVLPVTGNPFQSRWRCPRRASRRRGVTPEAAQPTPIPDAPLRARNGRVLGRRRTFAPRIVP